MQLILKERENNFFVVFLLTLPLCLLGPEEYSAASDFGDLQAPTPGLNFSVPPKMASVFPPFLYLSGYA